MRTPGRSNVRRIAALGTALGVSLGGCSVGPDFLRPAPPQAKTYLPEAPAEFVSAGISGGETQSLVQGMDIPGQWWQVFQSPQLNGLID